MISFLFGSSIRQYFIVMFGIFITMLVGGILGYAFRDKVASTMRTRMFASLGEYGQRQAVTDAWDFTQSTVRWPFGPWTRRALERT